MRRQPLNSLGRRGLHRWSNLGSTQDLSSWKNAVIVGIGCRTHPKLQPMVVVYCWKNPGCRCRGKLRHRDFFVWWSAHILPCWYEFPCSSRIKISSSHRDHCPLGALSESCCKRSKRTLKVWGARRVFSSCSVIEISIKPTAWQRTY